MTDFDKEVTIITIKEVPADSGPLCLPIQPCAQGTIMNPIVMDLYIQGGMQFNTGDFMSIEFSFQGNIVDMIIIDFTKDATQMTDDPILPTIIDGVITDNMGANHLSAPTRVGSAED
jgi:hypothetical protein